MKFTDELKQLRPGATLTTEKTKAVCYVTAKRCGLSVTVDDKDGKRIVKLAGHPTDDVIARLKVLSASDRLKVFESFELCCGMNRGSCICEAESIEPAQPIADEPKDTLAAFIAKAQAKKGITPGPITIETDPIDEWTGWGKEEQTYDDQTGEMRTFRRHIKSGRVKWLDAETWFGQ